MLASVSTRKKTLPLLTDIGSVRNSNHIFALHSHGRHGGESHAKLVVIDDECRRPLCALIAKAYADPTLELELRIGRQTTSAGFQPGVDRQTMDGIVKLLDNTADARPVGGTEWQESEDYYLGHMGKRCRTRVTFQDNAPITTETISKEAVHSFVLRTQMFDVRVSLSRETPKPCPVKTSTTHVRIKQTRRYEAVRSPIRFDCSMVWSGETKSEAEHMQNNKEAVFEVECELTVGRTDDAWKRKYDSTPRGISRLATSMLAKLSDLMHCQGIRYVAL